MDFMKVFDQTVREIKREVNLKVLKVPEIEQKALDATDDEPWGPHGTALAELANATKKFSECQIVMNVLWTRLYETGKEWRCVYKSLAVIEYLVSHGSERAVDDIIEHTFQISSLTTFEYVEPSGKDLGINVRKKAENIVTLLNNRDKIQEVRNKASANRDKYIGLSSSGITYKSGAPSYSSGGFSGGGGGYGGMGAIRDTDSFRERNKERDRYGEQSYDPDTYSKSQQGSTLKKEYTRHGSKDQDNKFSSKSSVSNNYQSAKSPSNEDDDEDFDDFDPRGTSSTKAATGNSNAATGSSNQVDLFGPSLIDVFDAPEPAPAEKPAVNSNSSDVDLFADASFVSASPQPETVATSETQKNVDLFASQPAMISAPSSNIDFFAAPEPVLQPETKPPTPQQTSAAIVDPFATVPLNNFNGSDMFGSFTSHPNTVSEEPKQNPAKDANLNILSAKPLENTKPPQKKDGFQVKSGIWSDSLSRGLIDLNISAPKKVNLADVGIVGLTDTDEREKGPPTSFYMGRAMGAGSGLGRTSSISTQASGGDDFFSTLGSQQYQFNNLKK